MPRLEAGLLVVEVPQENTSPALFPRNNPVDKGALDPVLRKLAVVEKIVAKDNVRRTTHFEL